MKRPREEDSRSKYVIEVSNCGPRSLYALKMGPATLSEDSNLNGAIGSRQVFTLPPEEAFETSDEAMKKVFHPCEPGDFTPGSFCVCLYSGAVAQLMGVREVFGKSALHLKFDCFNGAVPVVSGSSFLDRWHHVSVLHSTDSGEIAPFLKPWSTYRVPTSVLPSSLAAQRSRPQPFSIMSRVDARYAVDFAATADQGLQGGMVVLHDGVQCEILGFTPCLSPSRASLQLMCRTASDAGKREYRVIPSGAVITIVSHFRERRFRTEMLPRPRAKREIKVHLPKEDPAHGLLCNFRYRLGVTCATMNYFDNDPVRCEYYFGVLPGERTSEPKPATVIGMQRLHGHVRMFYDIDGNEGAAFWNVGTIVQLTGEVVQVGEVLGVPFPSMRFDPISGCPVKKITLPEIPKESSSTQYYFVFPYLVVGGRRMLLDTTSLPRFGLHHGQRAIVAHFGGTIIGIGKLPESENGKVHLWFLSDNHPLALPCDDGEEITLFDSFVEIEPSITRTYFYTSQPESDELPPIEPTLCFPEGRESNTHLQLFDNDPERCQMYFNLLPGTRVDGCSTVVGMYVNDRRVYMGFLRDGEYGAGTCADGTYLQVNDEVLVDIKSTIRGRILKYAPQQLDPSQPVVPNVRYPIDSEWAVMVPLCNDEKTMYNYFGVVPGHRLNGDITVVGLLCGGTEVRLVIHVDGEHAAQILHEKMDFCLIDEDIHPVKYAPLFKMRSIWIRKLDEDPHFLVQLDYPLRSGRNGRYVTFYDVRPEAVQHYFKCKPGERVARNTILGLRLNVGGKVCLAVQNERKFGASVLEDSVLCVEPNEPRQLATVYAPPSVHPFPRGSSRTCILPSIRRLPNPRCDFPALVNQDLVLIDTKSLPEMAENMIQHGQRCVIEETPCVMVGLLVYSGEVQFVAQIDGGEFGIIKAKTEIHVFDEFFAVRPANVCALEYSCRPYDPDLGVHETHLHNLGVGVPTLQRFDVDPDRCERYFGVRPGQRVDGVCTIIGMRRANDWVWLFGLLDGKPGAGSWSHREKLWIENGVFHPFDGRETHRL